MLLEIYPLQVMEPLLLPVADLQLLLLRGPTHEGGVEQSCGLQLQLCVSARIAVPLLLAHRLDYLPVKCTGPCSGVTL